MQLKFLNHASFIIETDNIKLLFDPWFQGTVFGGGWGLRFHNPSCFKEAKNCTHLWISHFHEDHFQVNTLKKIREINPDIIVLGNHSYHSLFQLDRALSKRIGFKNIISLRERKRFPLTESIFLTVFPSSSIDNMLFIETPESNILNYNDCNLPSRALQSFKKTMGTIDLLFLNYNTADKIMLPSSINISSVKEELKTTFIKKVNAFSPKYILPFASHHYFTSKYGIEENNTYLDETELAKIEPSVIPWQVGNTLSFNKDMSEYKLYSGERIRKNKWVINQPVKPAKHDLETAYFNFISRFRKCYWYLFFLRFNFKIKLEDTNQMVYFSTHNKNLNYLNHIEDKFDIVTGSGDFYGFIQRRYGTTDFLGATRFIISHYIPEKSLARMKLFFLLCYMMEHEIDAISMIKFCLFGKGCRFLWNRREEICTLLFNLNKIKAAEDRI